MKSWIQLAIALTALLAAAAVAWDTDNSEEGWKSAYIKALLEKHNEHRQLSEMAWRQLGLDAALPFDQPAATVVDLNASIFRFGPTASSDTKGDISATQFLEERELPHPVGFAGLPDFSYTLYDWINKNAESPCPVLPKDAEAQALCHKFRGWMGALNSNHFGTQATLSYSRYHEIALTQARRARQFRERMAQIGTTEEYDAYLPMLREMELEALTYEGIAQHYLQDRWSIGHMFERWGSADYGQLKNKDFWFNFVVGWATGLLHGSQGVTGWHDSMSSPLIVGGQIFPATWVYGNNPESPFPGVGDYRLSDMNQGPGGTYENQNLRISAQKSGMLACMAGGWADVVASFGKNHRNASNYGALEFPLRDTRGVDDSCFDVWATDAAIIQGMFADTLNKLLAPTPTGRNPSLRSSQEILDAIRSRNSQVLVDEIASGNVDELLGSISKVMPQIDAGMPGFEELSGFDLAKAYKYLRVNTVTIAAKVEVWMIHSAHTAKGLDQSTYLARGGLGPFGDAMPGNDPSHAIASWIEPGDLETLPEIDVLNGRDKYSLFGFFSRSHMDHWCDDAESVLRGLRSSSDITLEACTFLASNMYSGTDRLYQGSQQEKPAVRSACELLGHQGTSGGNDSPFWLAPGYVGGDSLGQQVVGKKKDGTYQSVINWCQRVPVVDLRRGPDNILDPSNIVASGAVDELIRITGHHLGALDSVTGPGRLILQSIDIEGQEADIESWRPSEITFRAPAQHFDEGDYRLRVISPGGAESVGLFVLRLTAQGADVEQVTQHDGSPESPVGICTSEHEIDPNAFPNYSHDTYHKELQRLEQLRDEKDAILLESVHAANAEQEVLVELVGRRDRLLEDLATKQVGLTDTDSLFLETQPVLVQRIERLRQLIEDAGRHSDPDSKPNQDTIRETQASLSRNEVELAGERSRWEQGDGRTGIERNNALANEIDRLVNDAEELRWGIKRRQLDLFSQLEYARKNAARAEAAAITVNDFKRDAPVYLRRQIPPIVQSVIADNGYKSSWVTEEEEHERINRKIRITEAHLRASRDFKRRVEEDFRQTEQALLQSTQNWLALNERYSDKIYGEAWLTIGLELADSYENIFGVGSPRAALGKAELPYLIASEAIFRVGGALFGESPSIPEPKLARELLQARDTLVDQVPATAALARLGQHYPSTHVRSTSANSNTLMRGDTGYAEYEPTVVGRSWDALTLNDSGKVDMGNLKEHFKSQLQNAIDIMGESPITASLSQQQYWERTAMRLQGVMGNVVDDDDLRQATALLYASAGHQRELAGDSLRRMFTNGTVRTELMRLGKGMAASVAKDSAKALIKELIIEPVRQNRLDAYLDLFGEELAYYSHQRDYYFVSAQRRLEVAKISALEELLEEWITKRDRELPGRQLNPPHADSLAFESARHVLTIRFSKPVQDLKIRVVDSPSSLPLDSQLAEDGLSATVMISIDSGEFGEAIDTMRIEIQANAVLSEKVLDGDPHTVACYTAEEQWHQYERRPYIHRLKLSKGGELTGGRSSFVAVEYVDLDYGSCRNCQQEDRGQVGFVFDFEGNVQPIANYRLLQGRRPAAPDHDGLMKPGTYNVVFDLGNSTFREEIEVRPGKNAKITMTPGGIVVHFDSSSVGALNADVEIFDQSDLSVPAAVGGAFGAATPYYLRPGSYRVGVRARYPDGRQSDTVWQDNITVPAGETVEVRF